MHSALGDPVRLAIADALAVSDASPGELGQSLGLPSNLLAHHRTDEVARAADVVVTMGCGDACPVFPGKRYEDWDLDDPQGKDLAMVRAIRDQIEQRVRKLLTELGFTARR